MRRTRGNQRDLFDKRVQATEFQPDLRSKLALLLQVLLAEAAGVQQRRTKTADYDGADSDEVGRAFRLKSAGRSDDVGWGGGAPAGGV